MMSAYPIRRSLLIAAFYLLAAVLLNVLGQYHVIDAEFSERALGILMGVVVLFSANAIPKQLLPLDRMACDPVREQSLRRSAAWALVLGGVGFTLAYLLAPIAVASTLAIGLLAPAVLFVAVIKARCVWGQRPAA